MGIRELFGFNKPPLPGLLLQAANQSKIYAIPSDRSVFIVNVDHRFQLPKNAFIVPFQHPVPGTLIEITAQTGSPNIPFSLKVHQQGPLFSLERGGMIYYLRDPNPDEVSDPERAMIAGVPEYGRQVHLFQGAHQLFCEGELLLTITPYSATPESMEPIVTKAVPRAKAVGWEFQNAEKLWADFVSKHRSSIGAVRPPSLQEAVTYNQQVLSRLLPADMAGDNTVYEDPALAAAAHVKAVPHTLVWDIQSGNIIDKLPVDLRVSSATFASCPQELLLLTVMQYATGEIGVSRSNLSSLPPHLHPLMHELFSVED